MELPPPQTPGCMDQLELYRRGEYLIALSTTIQLRWHDDSMPINKIITQCGSELWCTTQCILTIVGRLECNPALSLRIQTNTSWFSGIGAEAHIPAPPPVSSQHHGTPPHSCITAQTLPPIPEALPQFSVNQDNKWVPVNHVLCEELALTRPLFT
jgi:hypothetical protein